MSRRPIVALVVVVLALAARGHAQQTPSQIVIDLEKTWTQMGQQIQALKAALPPDQPCAYTATPTDIGPVPASGDAPVVTIDTGPACNWTVAPSDPWVVASQPSGTGPTQVTLTVAPQTATTERTATVLAAGVAVRLRQAGETNVVTTKAALDAALAAKKAAITVQGVIRGNWTIGYGPVTITCVAGLPGRVTPSDVVGGQLVALDSTTPLLTVAANGQAHDVTVRGCTLTGSAPDRTLILVGHPKEPDVTKLPQRVTFDQNAILGVNGLGHRALELHGADMVVTRNHITGWLERFRQSQGIFSSNGPGPFLIEDNRIEASGENILFGGDDAKVPNLIPSDITIRNNDVYKPLDQYPPNSVVNLIELKNAQRVLIEHNVIDGSRVDVQTGNALTFTPRNQYGSAPWTTVRDVIVRGNTIKNYEGYAAQHLCSDNNFPSGRLTNVRYEYNLILGKAGITLTNGQDGDLALVNNTLPNITQAVVTFNGPQPPPGAGSACRPAFVMTKNVTLSGKFGINSQSCPGGQGHPTITCYTSTDVADKTKVGGNVIEENLGWGRWPAGNTMLPVGGLAPRLDPAFKYTPNPALGW